MHTMCYSEVRFTQTKFDCGFIHFPIEEAQVEVHSFNLKSVCDALSLTQLIEVGW